MTALFVIAALLVVVGCAPSEARAPEPAPAPPRHDAPAPRRVAWTPPPSPALSMSCGELALYRRALAAEGKGARHPDVLVTEARLAECPDPRPTVEACRAALLEREQLESQGKGPRHPDVIVARAMVDACRERFGDSGMPTPTPAPPAAAECETLKARRAALLAAGKGERHPEVLALDAQLESCP